MLLLVLVLTIPSTGATVRSLGPDWHHGLSEARLECAAGARTATVQVAPHTWHLSLRCVRL